MPLCLAFMLIAYHLRLKTINYIWNRIAEKIISIYSYIFQLKRVYIWSRYTYILRNILISHEKIYEEIFINNIFVFHLSYEQRVCFDFLTDEHFSRLLVAIYKLQFHALGRSYVLILTKIRFSIKVKYTRYRVWCEMKVVDVEVTTIKFFKERNKYNR